MDFKFVDDLEKAIAQYLHEYNQKAWELKGGCKPEAVQNQIPVREDVRKIRKWLGRLADGPTPEGLLDYRLPVWAPLFYRSINEPSTKGVDDESNRRKQAQLAPIIERCIEKARDAMRRIAKGPSTEGMMPHEDYLAWNWMARLIKGDFPEVSVDDNQIWDELCGIAVREHLNEPGEFPEGTVSDDRSQVWDYLDRMTRRNCLQKRREECEKDCQRIKKKNPLLIDKANHQLNRIQLLQLILNRISEYPIYTKWDSERLLKDINLDLLPHLSVLLKGHNLDSLIQKAKSWANSLKEENRERGATAFALRLLIDELKMTVEQAAKALQDAGDQTLKNRTTTGSLKKRYKDLQQQFRDRYPEEYRRYRY